MLYTNSVRLSAKPALRVLHVLGQMTEGGIENWLLRLLRRLHPNSVQMDFLVETNHTYVCSFEDEIRVRGSRIFTYPHTLNFWRYDRQIKQILYEYGPYDIVHSHDNFIGCVMRSSKQAGVPIRIAHSHTDLFAVQTLFKTQASFQRCLAFQLFLNLNRKWATQYATLGFGCSQNAAASLFGVSWETDPRWHVLYCGIDLAPFRVRPDPVRVRAELGIPEDSFVIGHVGRFAEPKNHKFLLNVFANIVQQNPKTHLLLIGEGQLRPEIQGQVKQMGLANHVTFTGARSDVPRLMMGAMDAFLFPSLFEGLGLVLVEAQAAGLPCLISDLIPADADVVHPLIHRFPLTKPPSEWAEKLLQLRDTRPLISSTEALDRVDVSPLNFERTLRQLETFYQTQYAQTTLASVENRQLVLRI